MKKHCPICKEEREFNHISEDALENIYECDTCAFKYKRKTRTGWATTLLPGAAGGGFLGGLVATVLGNEHDDS